MCRRGLVDWMERRRMRFSGVEARVWYVFVKALAV
jgi:hypothetical protein